MITTKIYTTSKGSRWSLEIKDEIVDGKIISNKNNYTRPEGALKSADQFLEKFSHMAMYRIDSTNGIFSFIVTFKECKVKGCLYSKDYKHKQSAVKAAIKYIERLQK